MCSCASCVPAEPLFLFVHNEDEYRALISSEASHSNGVAPFAAPVSVVLRPAKDTTAGCKEPGIPSNQHTIQRNDLSDDTLNVIFDDSFKSVYLQSSLLLDPPATENVDNIVDHTTRATFRDTLYDLGDELQVINNFQTKQTVGLTPSYTSSSNPLDCNSPKDFHPKSAPTKVDKLSSGNDVTENSSHRKVLPPCRVCGNMASGFHYGVNTCEACKGFFRRSLKKGMALQCKGDSNCLVKGDKRSHCAYCRFQRCLSLGMSKMAIKTGRYTHEKRTKDILEVRGLWGPDRLPRGATRQEVDDLLIPILDCGYALHYSTRNHSLDTLLLAQSSLQKNWSSPGFTKELFNLFFQRLYRMLLTGLCKTDKDKSDPETSLASNYINFANSLPLFSTLSHEDQFWLLKSSWLEVLIVGDNLSIGRCSQEHNYQSSSFPKLSQVAGEDFVDVLCEVLHTLKRFIVTLEELIMVRALVLVFSDRCTLQNPRRVDECQWLVVRCFLHLLQKNHGRHSERKFADVIRHVTNIRSISEEVERLARDGHRVSVIKSCTTSGKGGHPKHYNDQSK